MLNVCGAVAAVDTVAELTVHLRPTVTLYCCHLHIPCIVAMYS